MDNERNNENENDNENDNASEIVAIRTISINDETESKTQSTFTSLQQFIQQRYKYLHRHE